METTARLFDVYLAVDWSARSRPSATRPVRDALWVGEAGASGILGAAPGETYWRTRGACLAYLQERLIIHVAAGRRVLLGCDFAYGFPAGFAAALGLPGPTAHWERVWKVLAARIVDKADNANNRFAVAAALNTRCRGPGPGPFWGCPRAQAGLALARTSPAYPFPTARGPALARLRTTDQAVPGVQPVWKLLGSGSVGGQTLLGIPAVARLRAAPALAACSRVWPFETGFTAHPIPPAGPAVLHAEIWPGLVPGLLDPAAPIRDQAQVRAVVLWLAALDAAGRLAPLFAGPRDLGPAVQAQCVAEEGWILGAGAPAAKAAPTITKPPYGG